MEDVRNAFNHLRTSDPEMSGDEVEVEAEADVRQIFLLISHVAHCLHPIHLLTTDPIPCLLAHCTLVSTCMMSYVLAALRIPLLPYSCPPTASHVLLPPYAHLLPHMYPYLTRAHLPPLPHVHCRHLVCARCLARHCLPCTGFLARTSATLCMPACCRTRTHATLRMPSRCHTCTPAAASPCDVPVPRTYCGLTSLSVPTAVCVAGSCPIQSAKQA
jgi:hypothetical protein